MLNIGPAKSHDAVHSVQLAAASDDDTAACLVQASVAAVASAVRLVQELAAGRQQVQSHSAAASGKGPSAAASVGAACWPCPAGPHGSQSAQLESHHVAVRIEESGSSASEELAVVMQIQPSAETCLLLLNQQAR